LSAPITGCDAAGKPETGGVASGNAKAGSDTKSRKRAAVDDQRRSLKSARRSDWTSSSSRPDSHSDDKASVSNHDDKVLVGYRSRFVADGVTGKPRRQPLVRGACRDEPIYAVANVTGGDDGADNPKYCVEVNAELGGTIAVWPELISEATAESIASEAFTSNRFRRYKVNGGFEPRVHYLLHDEATDDFDGADQPGYRYSGVNMKSRRLQSFSTSLAKLCGVPSFNIGVDVVLYRAGKDKIGKHADDTQGEDRVMSVVVKSPNTPRHIVIEPQKPKVGDEYIILRLGARDAYCMDHELQKHYVHSVPASTAGEGSKGTNEPRLVTVLRHGTMRMVKDDGGVPVDNVEYTPPTLPYRWGEDSFPELKLDRRYSRSELVQYGIHRSCQKGISGNALEGCDAIVVSGRSEGAGVFDTFESLTYTATTNVGALALKTSHDVKKPIRVLRRVEPQPQAMEAANRPYRYDGLYTIDSYKIKEEADPRTGVPRPLYYFLLSRANAKTTQQQQPRRSSRPRRAARFHDD
jgi:SAD/SRA domain/2OG-Fe(II) oxygenase superfamily